MSSPTARTLKVLRDAGCLAATVEHWNPWARVRQDLFGCIDVLAITPAGLTLALQVCSGAGGDGAERVRKLQDALVAHPQLAASLWSLQVWAWRKVKRGARELWAPRIVVVHGPLWAPIHHPLMGHSRSSGAR